MKPVNNVYAWVNAMRRKTSVGARTTLQVRGAELMRAPPQQPAKETSPPTQPVEEPEE